MESEQTTCFDRAHPNGPISSVNWKTAADPSTAFEATAAVFEDIPGSGDESVASA